MVWTDPPYFLSTEKGTTCKNGKRAKVNKGKWDESKGLVQDHQFYTEWLAQCQRVLKPNGTIWVSATHTLFSIGYAMQQLGFKILNLITWEKPNPPPNLSCRYFTHRHTLSRCRGKGSVGIGSGFPPLTTKERHNDPQQEKHSAARSSPPSVGYPAKEGKGQQASAPKHVLLVQQQVFLFHMGFVWLGVQMFSQTWCLGELAQGTDTLGCRI